MRHWTHNELHALMDNNNCLKTKSDRAHVLPRVSSEEQEYGKRQMMEIYAEAINCQKVGVAKEFVRRAFSCLRQGETLDELKKEYASQKLCHSSLGNDYICFCNGKTA